MIKAKQQRKTKTKKKSRQKHQVLGWLTSDEDEIIIRQQRAENEKIKINPLDIDEYFSHFTILTESNKSYLVEIRSLSEKFNSCSCLDYQTNQLGTCKHIEKVLLWLEKKGKRKYKYFGLQGSPRIEIYADLRDGMAQGVVKILYPSEITTSLEKMIASYFDSNGVVLTSTALAIQALKNKMKALPKQQRDKIRWSQHLQVMLGYQGRQKNKQKMRDDFLKDVKQGKKSIDFLKHPLFSYQQQGMLHLAFNERALLADEMGLGKTVQAIAACELLRRYNGVKKILIIATASLKAEWAEQFNKFCDLEPVIVYGTRLQRLSQYQADYTVYLLNYEQVTQDYQHIQQMINPDIIVLDEAQRIKNWRTKTAMILKQLRSRYAFVLTGTPVENRIDDIYSIVQFLDPHFFGPLFRFNRDYYELDDKGRAVGYKNLSKLNQALSHIMLRRLKSDVEGELPKCIEKNYFVKMESEQRERYCEYEQRVSRLANISRRRPLRKEEMEKLQKYLACMRMVCDTPYILDSKCNICPKLDELKNVLVELLAERENKIIIFSEWTRMLDLVASYCDDNDIGYAWHTGNVPQQKRREYIKRFKQDPDCRLFLSSDAGSVGLNLQQANVVINLDLPWNPAKLEQRIARAWRKHQTRTVHILNFICEDSIEQRMVNLLSQKKAMASSVLEGGYINKMPLPSGRAALMKQIDELFPIEQLKHQKKGGTKTNDMCGDLSARFSQCLDTLSIFENELQQQFALAVTDNTDTTKNLEQYLKGKDSSENIIAIDRATFQLLEKLAKAGVISINQPRERVCKANTEKKIIRPAWLDKSRQKLQVAQKTYDLAIYLISGEFIDVALPHLQQSCLAVISALLALSGVECPQDELVKHQSSLPKQMLKTYQVVLDENLLQKMYTDVAKNVKEHIGYVNAQILSCQ